VALIPPHADYQQALPFGRWLCGSVATPLDSAAATLSPAPTNLHLHQPGTTEAFASDDDLAMMAAAPRQFIERA